MIKKRLVKGICGLAMVGGALLGMISPAMEAEARVDSAEVKTRVRSGKREFWTAVSGYNVGRYRLYGYLNRSIDNKVCSMGSQTGTGRIFFSTSPYSTNEKDGYTVGSFYAKGLEELNVK